MILSLQELLQQLALFYQSWHLLEATFGADDGRIIDFDFCPRELLSLQPIPFGSRLEALDRLQNLRQQLEAFPAEAFANHAYLQLKLRGSEAYLRALMGERWKFSDYLEATMGIEPRVTSTEELQQLREELRESLDRYEIPFSQEGAEVYRARMTQTDMGTFEARLRAEAELWVGRIQSRVGLNTAPHYSVEFAHEDAYWANWIDGAVGGNIRLRINLHPRISFMKSSETNYAVHEIGGHAVNVLEMDAARRAGSIDGPSMHLTVHSCEAYQMEGLAQSVLQLLAEPGELPDALELDIRLRALHGALINNAQVRLEDGAGIEEVVADLMAQAPLLKPSKILSDLRDRLRHPLYRGYMYVYQPSHRDFLEALRLGPSARMSFLREAYTRLMTPSQLRALIRRLAGDADSGDAMTSG